MKLKTWLLALFFCFLFNSSALYANIKVGTVFFYPPFVMSTGDGFDIDLMRAICQRIKETCDIVPMDYTNLFTSLNEGKIDLAIAGISISQNRGTKYLFSLPYMLSKGQFLTLKSYDFTSINDLTGKKVGVIKGEQDGGVVDAYLIQNYGNQFQTIPYNDIEDLITSLSDGDVAAAFIHRSSANYWKQNGGGQFALLGGSVSLGQGIGIMALPSQADLIARINQQLQAMEKDGSYLNLYNIYFTNE
ncbi:arginine-binding periplasmic protein [Legionella nautarum]|uniref:Arginine-binding periplasmic protein n=1 Tax=Legionella nautarum TaxID=45070 RepID=A0A0W0WM42_9GAMM|nr:transporter substrate-binding domain-containing protein [Legionella nautarum]KTD33396.1 arginine-binding periplasmic protein [Legionella nautarum]